MPALYVRLVNRVKGNPTQTKIIIVNDLEVAEQPLLGIENHKLFIHTIIKRI